MATQQSLSASLKSKVGGYVNTTNSDISVISAVGSPRQKQRGGNNEMKMLPFRIIDVSSEDPSHPASQLENNGSIKRDSNNLNNSSNEGWQSKKNCTYPQYIIIQPYGNPGAQQSDGSNEIENYHDDNNNQGCAEIFHLTKMEILIHNHKIPQKIEIFVSQSVLDNSSVTTTNESPRNSCNNSPARISNSLSSQKQDVNNNISSTRNESKIQFERLGYITFDNNTKTQYRARELKSISLHVKATYIKLVIHSCHGYNESESHSLSQSEDENMNISNVNPFHQVGIVDIGLFQRKEKEDQNLVVGTKSKSRRMLSPTLSSLGSKTSQERSQQIDVRSDRVIDSLPSKKKETPTKSDRKIIVNEYSTNRPVNPNDISDFQSRVAKLEEIKHSVAEREDFDTAARIKDIVIEINALFTTFKKLQLDMRHAAETEDYVEASRLKLKRDKARGVAIEALKKAEDNVGKIVVTEKRGNYYQPRYDEVRVKNNGLDDLSLSTIRRVEDDDPSIAMTMTGRSFNIEDRPIMSRQDSSHQEKDLPIEEEESANVGNHDEFDENDEHPLEGVPNYKNLPNPEDIQYNDRGLANSFNSSNSLASTDSYVKIETILGRYRTKCFLSKNWSLREAALLKLSLILPEVIEKHKKEGSVGPNWWDTFSRSICIILERAIDDKIVQVFLTGLILLDDCANEFEKLDISQKETISLLGNIIMNLVEKLSSSNQKVVEGAETALMSLALFSGIGPSYVGSQAMKRMASKDSRGKLVCARFRLLRDIVNEFGSEAPHGQKLMDFVKTNGLGHKDAEVREAAKELTTAIYLRDGSSVASMLDGLTERQVKEYKISFASAKQAMKGGQQKSNGRIASNSKRSSAVADINDVLNSPAVEKRPTEANAIPTPRGRGRGRGRRVVSSKNTQAMERAVGIPNY